MLDLTTIAIEAQYAQNGHVLHLVDLARRGSELAMRSLQAWQRWAVQHRELRLRGLYDAQEKAA